MGGGAFAANPYKRGVDTSVTQSLVLRRMPVCNPLLLVWDKMNIETESKHLETLAVGHGHDIQLCGQGHVSQNGV